MVTKPTTLCVQLQPPGCTSLEWMNSWSWRELEIVALRCSQLQKNLRQALSDILNCSKKTRTDSSKEICSVPTLPAVASSYSEYHWHWLLITAMQVYYFSCVNFLWLVLTGKFSGSTVIGPSKQVQSLWSFGSEALDLTSPIWSLTRVLLSTESQVTHCYQKLCTFKNDLINKTMFSTIGWQMVSLRK